MENFDLNYGVSVGVPAWIYSLGMAPLLVLMSWSLFWKGLALWHAGRRREPWWFVILLVVNTVGILEIFYIFVILKLKPSELFNKK